MPLTAGSRVGVYEVAALIGAGGMGEVYRAHDAKLNRDVALKVLPAAFALDADRLARFRREAQVLAALNHPNVATIHGLEEADGVHALVLELVDGPTLADRIAAGRIPIDEALSIARQIVDALEAAHEHGIVHRDLKPSNIKLRPDGTVKVLDFGLAKALDPEVVGAGFSRPDATASPTVTSPMMLTATGIILGTAAYMSPEQAKGGTADRRSDVWAFGAVLYEMLTGKRAFRGDDVADVLVAVLSRDPDWELLRSCASPELVRLVERCLRKDPKRRLHDIADAGIELDDASHRATPDEAGGGSSADERHRSRGRLSQRLAWMAVGVAVALVAAWIFLAGPSRGDPARVEIAVFPPRGATFPFEGGAPWPSVSPDGRQLAFVAVTADGQQQLWLRPLDSTEARALPGTDGASRPFWSPDSGSLGYFANGRLWRIDLPAGAPQVVADAPYLGGMSATWGRQGMIVFNHSAGLHRVPAAGGPATVVLNADVSSAGPATPAFLPDGLRFLFVLEETRRERTQVCVGSLDAEATRCVLTVHSPARYAPPGYLLFVRDAVLRAQRFDVDRLEVSGEPFRVADTPILAEPVWRPPPFSVSDNGVLAYHPSTGETRLVWVDRSGKTLSTVGPLGDYGDPELSPDETRIIVSRRDIRTGNVDLWLYDVPRGTTSRFTFEPSVDGSAVFSPDGNRLVFSAGRSGSPAIVEKLTSGAGREEPIVDVSGSPTDWSSDGRWLLYQRFNPTTDWDLWVAPAARGAAPRAVVQSEHGEREGRFSPDVRWIAYDSTESGRREVWIQPYPATGARWQVSTRGGFSPRWRGDGRELYYVAADGKLTAVGVTPNRQQATIDVGAPRALFQTMFREGAYGSYAVSRDGQRFLLNLPPEPADVTPITVVLNWTSALRN